MVKGTQLVSVIGRSLGPDLVCIRPICNHRTPKVGNSIRMQPKIHSQPAELIAISVHGSNRGGEEGLTEIDNLTKSSACCLVLKRMTSLRTPIVWRWTSFQEVQTPGPCGQDGRHRNPMGTAAGRGWYGL